MKVSKARTTHPGQNEKYSWPNETVWTLFMHPSIPSTAKNTLVKGLPLFPKNWPGWDHCLDCSMNIALST